MPRVEKPFRTSQLTCTGAYPELPVQQPISRTIFTNGKRDVSCPLLVEGTCSIPSSGAVSVCKQLFPGEYYFPKAEPSREVTLTRRQAEVLNEQAAGLPKEAIARKLFITQRTINTHTDKTYTALRAHNMTRAILIGAKLGVVDIEAALAGLDPQAVQTLTPTQDDVLKMITQSLGEISTADALSNTLPYTKNTVITYLYELRKQLGNPTKPRAALLYVVGKRETQAQS